MPQTLDETDWEMLLDQIARGKCTPFIGASAGVGVLPLGGQLADHLATQWNYPFDDRNDPTRVTQFRAVTTAFPMRPKEDSAICSSRSSTSAREKQGVSCAAGAGLSRTTRGQPLATHITTGAHHPNRGRARII